MLETFLPDVSGGAFFLMILCIIAVAFFEFVNGFHDTANAVATVIYTKTLKPLQAVVWSGIWNFLGVWAGGIAVAMSIIALLPLVELLDQPLPVNIALVAAVLITAISWNLLTWYFGIPCSSSHTLIGSLLGAGLGFWWTFGGGGINWNKAYDIGMSLLLSPAFGFSVVIMLMFLFRIFIKNKEIFKEPDPNAAHRPPFWIRMTLIGTCTLVSFFHGSNDGQKGVGLMMIILLAFAPLEFALNPNIDPHRITNSLAEIQVLLERQKDQHIFREELSAKMGTIQSLMLEIENLSADNVQQKISIRKRLQLLRKNMTTVLNDPIIFPSPDDRRELKNAMATLEHYTDFAPLWVILLIALSLGSGTMIGWKRIVVTIGEKIGKTHLTYAQGAAAELVAAATIGMSTGLGLPVSTTHVLSSGIAGSMVAGKGIKNLQKNTVINIGLAWILTLPVTIIGASVLFLVFHYFI